MKTTIKEFANASLMAYQNPYQSVQYVVPSAFAESCKVIEGNHNPIYFGVKETQILEPMKQAFLEAGFLFHTIDKMTANGRAIDTTLLNPLTGRMMTGSSSGTAVNVLLGINDIGIGSDGGGSVLAPAMAVQLYGMIHPDFPVQLVTKTSTDGLSFSPCGGVITKDFSMLERAISVFKMKPVAKRLSLAVPAEFPLELVKQFNEQHDVQIIDFPDVTKDREILIKWLEKVSQEYDVILSLEGPIDTMYYGDSILGTFGEESKKRQEQSGKGLLRVINMLDLVGVTIPYKELAMGLLMISEPEQTDSLLALVKEVTPHVPELVQRYFHQK